MHSAWEGLEVNEWYEWKFWMNTPYNSPSILLQKLCGKIPGHIAFENAPSFWLETMKYI